jgi:glycogen debranching enzyme GlgX/4-alpha-glucanotransferase
LTYPAGGDPEPLGVTPRGDGVNVAVFSAHATAIEFCLFEGEREVRRIPLRGRTGDVFHDHIPGIASGARYGLRAHGPFLPREGHRFNPSKLLVDPYARAIDRPFALHPSMFGYRTDGLSFDDTDSAAFVPKAIVPGADLFAAARRITPWSRTVIYELQIRGFTMRHPGVPSVSRGRFAGLADPAAIEHLVKLGVTAVEIMPCAAWIKERHLAPLGLENYWGYNPVALMAPDPGLAPGGWAEIRSAVAALAEAGIESILDVVLNHTGEGDAHGPTLSLRGLDNATYYRLPPGEEWNYVDDTGCGNTLALDRPAPMRLAMDALRLWAAQAGVHGFRFDLATTLGRRAAGFDPAAPLLSAIAQDPLLRELKLIAEPWDVGLGGYQAGAFPPSWAEWNDKYRDAARQFWRGDPGRIGELATRLAGSADLFGSRRHASRSINFVVAHDGFTLADLVSYTHKVNQANGENNRDGTDANISWNNGVEGPTTDADITEARLRDQRALLATLLLARGTPMLTMGMEFGHSQGGNNNAYAQDNAVSWLDWAAADPELIAWTARLLRIRREHPALRDDRFLTGAPQDGGPSPDVEWCNAAGQAMSQADWDAPGGDTLTMVLAAKCDRVTIVLNRGKEPVNIVLPASGTGWHVLADSAADDAGADTARSTLVVSPRSVVVLAEPPRGRAVTDPALIERLSRAAGIAPEWWDVGGRRTIVSDETKRALLAAMRLAASTEGEARDTLRQLGDERDRRAVPLTVVTRGDGPVVLALGSEPGLNRRPLRLTIERDGGETMLVGIGTSDGSVTTFDGIDGLPAQAWKVQLPELPIGRHRLWRDDAPDTVCHLTVAPPRCYLPDAITHGRRMFGVAAQLYALRRDGDQGIGDFTTLARLVEAAGRAGAATVGINPLHMLFPGQRNRASPYHPSDRRFLDPIYLDIGEAAAGATEFVDYAAVWALKSGALERRFAAIPSSEKDAFRTFIADGGLALRRFATFQAIAETRPEEWRKWPEGLRSPNSPAVEAFARAHEGRVQFHQYAQFLADRQFGAAAASGLELGIYRDLAVGAAPDGAEAWARDGELAQGAWVGAPPDPLAPLGQNWHLPPPIPARMADGGFRSFAGLLAANMRHAGALRIDHVLGLARLFWIPESGSGPDGAYVTYPLRDLLGQVALESMRARCTVVGEDLGTVPEGLRPVLAEANVLSYRVLLLERDGLGFTPPGAWPARAVSCVTTHDLPPLAGWWEAADLRERRELGLIAPGTDPAPERAAERTALVDALTREGVLDAASAVEPLTGTVVAAAHAYAAASAADLMMVQADDLAGERVGVNLPGTDTERPNWRRRVAVPVETLLAGDDAKAILTAVGRGRKEGWVG